VRDSCMEQRLSRKASYQKKNKPRNAKKKRRWLLIITIVLFIIGGSGAAAWWKVEGFLKSIQAEAEPGGSEPGVAKAETLYHAQEPMSIVVLGKDTRGKYGGGLTDVMILVTLNPQTKKVTMLSIPRDTNVVIPGEDTNRKINSVYKRGDQLREEGQAKGKQPEETGISLVKKTLESIYGVSVNNYVTVDFQGFRKVVDELGGLEVNVDRKLVYHDPTDGTSIDLAPGLQTLNGDQALGFVRHRHDDRGEKYFSTDYERNDRQQIVVKAAVDKMKSFAGITSFFSVLQAAGENIKTDLSTDQMKGIIGDFGKMDTNNIVSLENTGVDWDRANSRTVIPIETLNKNRLALQESMGVAPSTVTTYNDSPAGGSSRSKKKRLDTQEKTSNLKETAPQTKKKEKSAAAGEQTKKQTTKHAGSTDSTSSDTESKKHSDSGKTAGDNLLDPDKRVSESVPSDGPSNSGPEAPKTPEKPSEPASPEPPQSPQTKQRSGN
jgi:polyisoprenyl-teichoic acid--peptidoglycan teichoic acid transferase